MSLWPYTRNGSLLLTMWTPMLTSTTRLSQTSISSHYTTQCSYWLATTFSLVALSRSPLSLASSPLEPSSTPIYSVIWRLSSLIWTKNQLSSKVRSTRPIQQWRTWNYRRRSRIGSSPTCSTSNRHLTIRMSLESSSGWLVPRSKRRSRASSFLNNWSKTWSLPSTLKSKTTSSQR